MYGNFIMLQGVKKEGLLFTDGFGLDVIWSETRISRKGEKYSEDGLCAHMFDYAGLS